MQETFRLRPYVRIGRRRSEQMQGGYPYGAPPPPVQRSGGSWAVWLAVGCGGLVLLMVVAGIFAFSAVSQDKGFKKLVQNAASGPERAQSLLMVRQALHEYRQENNGKYPDTLEKLVPKYLNRAD